MASYDKLPKQVQEVALNLSNLENGEKEITDSLDKLLHLTRGDHSALYEQINVRVVFDVLLLYLL